MYLTGAISSTNSRGCALLELMLSSGKDQKLHVATTLHTRA